MTYVNEDMKMYKLFNQQTTVQAICFVSRRAGVQRCLQLCSFCKFVHSKRPKSQIHLQLRHYIATMNLTELHVSLKKKSRWKSKKYAELLEVTEGTTNSKQADARELNALHLVLVDCPDISSDKLHKINNSTRHKKPNVRNINTKDNVPKPNYSTNHEGNMNTISTPNSIDKSLEDTWTLVKEQSPLTNNERDKCSYLLDITDASQNVGIARKDSEASKTSKDGPLESEMENYNLSVNVTAIEDRLQSILATIYVYIKKNMLQEAYEIFMRYRANKKLKLRCTKHIKIYNTILEGYASEGSHTLVLNIYKMMNKDFVSPTPQTFAFMFEAVGKQRSSTNIKVLLKEIESEMFNKGISFNDVVTKAKFKNNQRDDVIRAIRELNPEFKPSYSPPNVKYNCGLLGNNICKVQQYESPIIGVCSIVQLQEALSKQINIESNGLITIKSIQRLENDVKIVSSYRKKITVLEQAWLQAASEAFDRNLSYLKSRDSVMERPLKILHPFFSLLKKDAYMSVIMHKIRELCEGSEGYTSSVAALSVELGTRIYKKFEIQEQLNSGNFCKTIDIYRKYLKWYSHYKNSDNTYINNNRIVWQRCTYEADKYGPSIQLNTPEWSYSIRLSIGKFLFNIILNDIKINVSSGHSIPAFYTLFRSNGNRLTEQVKPHPLVSKLYKIGQFETLTFPAEVVPLLCPPQPWTSVDSGGYILLKAPFMRICQTSAYLHNEVQSPQFIPPQQLYPAFDCLNQLGSIPWKINSCIVDLMIKIFQEGGSEELGIPLSPDALEPIPPLSITATPLEKARFSAAKAGRNQRKMEMYALWCEALYKLSLANHYRDEIFWLPHNLDFRGRSYPIPPHLNHIGPDMARAMLLFAHGKRLGPNGLDWLKLHIINLTGQKKMAPIRERIKFANAILEDILDSAEHPLTGKMWWKTSDEPWQTLSACMELASALKAPDAEEYVSHFPIHQDGSCNGLQHYAALGRDLAGAKSVNLYPCDTPQDVYTSVASLVEKQRESDAQDGVVIAQELEGFVKRKVVKQTVMTTVYGVTRYGARLQIAKQLKDVHFPDQLIWPGSMYLVNATFQSIRTLFKSAREIQDWFETCAQIITSVYGKQVNWITPLGIPIIQPYTKRTKSKSKDKKIYEKPDIQKQINAFAPNFVHSLDSSHMMLTSLYCQQVGITFMSVHDCFWTHACTADIMNKICREQFVALHSEPILQDLADHFIGCCKQYNSTSSKNKNFNLETSSTSPRSPLKNVPTLGNFKLQDVLSSIYFFS